MSSATVHLSNEYHPSTQILSLNRFLMRSHLHFITLTKNHHHSSPLKQRLNKALSRTSKRTPIWVSSLNLINECRFMSVRRHINFTISLVGSFHLFIFFYLLSWSFEPNCPLHTRGSKIWPNHTQPELKMIRDDDLWFGHCAEIDARPDINAINISLHN